VDDLKRERVERKQELEGTLNREQETRVASLRETVMEKWTKEAMNTDGDLEAIIRGKQPSIDEAMNELKSQKESEEAKLKERLAKRRQKLKEDLTAEKDKFEKEDLNAKDPLVEEELERKRQQALFQHQSQIESINGEKPRVNGQG
jgi:hypothetical protein